MAEKRNTGSLDKYRAKRKVEATPEPFGGGESDRPYLFVVQKHAARRTHYDLRLEWRGTLVSWAVPQGPSPNPSEKRLAVHVEDHPVEYADFEGIIPAGNYGAGAVIVWDQGRWRPLTDPDRLDADGKLHVEFSGYKLRGEYILVRTKRGEKDWLLFKKDDEWAREAPGGATSRCSPASRWKSWARARAAPPRSPRSSSGLGAAARGRSDEARADAGRDGGRALLFA